MSQENLTFEQAQRIKQELLQPLVALLRSEQQTQTRDFQRVLNNFPLDVASVRPYLLPGPIRSIYISDATDDGTEIRVMTSGDSEASKMEGFPIKRNQLLKWDSPRNNLYLDWDAQSGKTVTVYVSRFAQIESNRFTLVQSGGVNVSEGSGYDMPGGVTLNTASAVELFSANPDRNTGVVVNTTGQIAYIGNSTVTGATNGLPWFPNQILEWRNVAALYAILSAAVVAPATALVVPMDQEG